MMVFQPLQQKKNVSQRLKVSMVQVSTVFVECFNGENNCCDDEKEVFPQ